MAGGRESNMIEESTGRGLGIFDLELASRVAPQLGMGARDDLGLEGKLVRPERVRGCHPQPGAIGEAPDAERGIALCDVARDWLEAQGAPGVEMRDETNTMARSQRCRRRG